MKMVASPPVLAALDDYQRSTATVAEIARKHGVSPRAIQLRVRAFGIPSRNNWDRGYTVNQYGYAVTYAPNHPFARSCKSGQILEHVRLMELHLGRRLLPAECVHHKDLNRLNNGFDNLQLMSRGEHSRLHHRLRQMPKVEGRRNSQP